MLAWSSALYATSGGLEVPHAMVGVHVAWNVTQLWTWGCLTGSKGSKTVEVSTLQPKGCTLGRLMSCGDALPRCTQEAFPLLLSACGERVHPILGRTVG